MQNNLENLADRLPLAVEEIKLALNRLGNRERVQVLIWLCSYFDDEGTLRAPQSERSRITRSGVVYWLVRAPARK